MAKSQHWLTKVALAVVAATACFVSPPANADEIITLNPRSGVTQMVLLWQPSPSDPQVILLVFPGGGGNVGFQTTNGTGVARTAYLFSRQRHLLDRPGVAVAVITAPSDQPDMDSEFRRSSRHVNDMAVVVRELTHRYPAAKLVLLGHSRGTVSAAYVAQALRNRIGAVILMSGFYERDLLRGVGLSEFNFDALKTPLLIVHHVKDRCPTTLFSSAQKLTARFPSIVVEAPDETRPERPCAPGTNHWFAWREEETIDQVFNWIDGKAWSQLIR
jgi:predicted esterase